MVTKIKAKKATRVEKQAKASKAKIEDAVIVEKKVFLTGKEVVKKCKAKIVEIYIEPWKQYIRGQVPTPKIIKKLREKYKDADAFNDALFRASLIDFTEEDFVELEKSNGIRYLELMTAVISNTDLFSNALKSKNIKK